MIRNREAFVVVVNHREHSTWFTLRDATRCADIIVARGKKDVTVLMHLPVTKTQKLAAKLLAA